MKTIKWNDPRGFTLIEMAIILMVIGVLVTMGANMIGVLTKRQKLNEAREVVRNASESLTGYAATRGLIPGSGDFATIVTRASDAWGNALYYMPSSSLVTDGICARKTTELSVRVCPDSSCSSPSQTVDDVAFVVVSGGENFNIQTARKSGTVSVYDMGVPSVDDYVDDMNRPETYDDVVRWATLYELRVKGGCSGPQMRIINSELPSAVENDDYVAEVFAEGGVVFSSGGKYRWCVEAKNGKLPKWLKVKPSKVPVSKDCAGLSERKWEKSDTIKFEGNAKAGTVWLKVFARDDNDKDGSDDNIASRSFVLTVDKMQGSGSYAKKGKDSNAKRKSD